MQQGLPEQVAPYQLAAAGGTLQGAIKIAQLPLLDGLIFGQQAGSAGQIQASLHFSQDEHGGCLVDGHISGVLALQCQRCMKAMEWPVELDLRLHLAMSESRAGQLPDEADVVVVAAEGDFNPREWVEDEIILALPLVPKHDDSSECGVTVERPAAPEPEERPNPFSVLKNLKT